MEMLTFIKDTLNDMRSGIYDYTKDGQCSNCGECCSDFIPISDEEIRRIKKYVRRHHIKEQKKVYPTAVPVDDFTCPFRNSGKRRCEIYEVRPAICRDFRCDKPKKEIWADRDMYHGKYRVVRMRYEFFGKKHEE